MAVTLDQFKRAFSGKVSDDLLKKRDQQAEEALLQLNDAVKTLDKSAPDTERHKGALVDLVTQYAGTKKQNLSPQIDLGETLRQIYEATLGQLTQVRNSVASVSAPSPSAPAPSPIGGPLAQHDSRLDDGQVVAGPKSVNDESTYRANLQSIQADLDKALNAKPPDGTSRAIQDRLKSTHLMMTAAETSGDFKQAQHYSDELLGILDEYKRAVEAHNKRAKADQDAEAAFHKRYGELEWDIQAIIDFKAPSTEASTIQDEIVRERELMNVAVLQSQFAKANTHLNNIVAAWGRFNEIVKKHDQVVSEQWKKDAPKRAYEAKLKPIKARLEQITKRPPDPKDPLAAQVKKIVAINVRLQKQVAVKAPDYAAAAKIVDEILAALAQYDLSLAAARQQKEEQAKQKASQEETRAQADYPRTLQALDRDIEEIEQGQRTGGAPFDKKTAETLKQILAARKEFDTRKNFLGGYKGMEIELNKIRALIDKYLRESNEFWKGLYDRLRASLSKDDIAAAFDKKQAADDAIQGEQRKLKDQITRMDGAAKKQDFYHAYVVGNEVTRQLQRFKALVYKVPGADGKDITVKPRLLGPPVQGPSVNTLLMLLDKDGRGPIAHGEGAALNKDGTDLLTKWSAWAKLEPGWSKAVESLEKDVAKAGAAMAQVKQAGQAIKSGAGGDAVNKAIEEYDAAKDLAVEAVTDMKTRFLTYEGAVRAKNVAILRAEERAADRDKQKAVAKRDEESKKVDEKKNQLRTAAGMASSLLDPTKWKSIAITGAAIGAELIFESFISTERLTQLQKEVEVAEKKLQGIQDKGDREAIDSFDFFKQAAASDVEKVQQTYDRLYKAVEAKETNMLRAMEKAPATGEAAKAFLVWQALKPTAQKADALVAKYLSDAKGAANVIPPLTGRYWSFSVPEEGSKYAAAVKAASTGNGETLRAFSNYVDSAQAKAQKKLDFVRSIEPKADAALKQIRSELFTAVVKRKR